MERKKKIKEYTVTDELLACNLGGTLPVLATPAISALFENTALEFAQEYLGDDSTTVGWKISVKHLAPTRLGRKFRIICELKEHSGRFFRFRLEARDDAGVIATGEHDRVSVVPDEFMDKAELRER